LREIGATAATPVIALTARALARRVAQAGVRDRIINLGFNGYIPKPVDPKTFAAQVEAFLQRRHTVASIPRSPMAPPSDLL